MLWVIVFASIAVAGAVMLVSYGIWLAHKAADVLSEVAVLGDRGGQLAELLGQIQVPANGVVDLSVDHRGNARNPFDPVSDHVG